MRRFKDGARSQDPDLLLGLDAPDDAAVYKVTGEIALVQTVDFFTPIVDDPYVWGQIAAANAFSDVYAMGGSPKLALNLVGWPRENLSLDLLAAVLEGAADKAKEAGVAVVGGHTIDDAEPKFGMAVTGFVHPDRVVRASTARPGDLLVLTKAIGTGIISTAMKRGAVDEPVGSAAISSMTSLNDRASSAMTSAPVSAATDVTGFGLIGHLAGMCEGSGVGAEIDAHTVPLLPGAIELAKAGMVPGGTRRNEDHFGRVTKVDPGLAPELRTLLFDAQTSGGLLMAVAPERLEALLAALDGNRVEVIAQIGRVTSGGPEQIVVR